jgi:hypothetical protein
MGERVCRLGLARLPDRNPVKRTIVCEPELNSALEDYARLYQESYGEAESVETLLPFMLSAFLAKDRAFTAFRKGRKVLVASRADEPLSEGRRSKISAARASRDAGGVSS